MVSCWRWWTARRRRGWSSALFEAMLAAAGAGSSRAARLSPGVRATRRERVVRRFAVFTGSWPWCWTPGQLEAWVAAGGWAHSTVRLYQGSLACFLDYVCDPRYGWAAECEARVGARPVQVCHEGNTAVHVADYEGRPERRPLSRIELQSLFDVADEQVGEAARGGRKGWLTAFRDATLVQGDLRLGAAAGRGGDAGCHRLHGEPGGSRARRPRVSARCGSARRCGAARRAAGRWPR